MPKLKELNVKHKINTYTCTYMMDPLFYYKYSQVCLMHVALSMKTTGSALVIHYRLFCEGGLNASRLKY